MKTLTTIMLAVLIFFMVGEAFTRQTLLRVYE